MSAAYVYSGPTYLSHCKSTDATVPDRRPHRQQHHHSASILLSFQKVGARGGGGYCFSFRTRTCPHSLLFRSLGRSPSSKNGSRRWKPTAITMEWQECSSEIEVDVPCSVAYDCYSERESIPKWMPFISSVKVLENKPDLSRWSLKYEVFGRTVEFSWLARNLQPIPNQKIHWRSLEGLPNKGAVRFYPKGSSACRVQLTVSYEVPGILVPVASALRPFVEVLLSQGLERFTVIAKESQTPRARILHKFLIHRLRR